MWEKDAGKSVALDEFLCFCHPKLAEQLVLVVEMSWLSNRQLVSQFVLAVCNCLQCLSWVLIGVHGNEQAILSLRWLATGLRCLRHATFEDNIDRTVLCLADQLYDSGPHINFEATLLLLVASTVSRRLSNLQVSCG